MRDPKLVESVLGEEWVDSGGELCDARRSLAERRCLGDFWRLDDESKDVLVERARQAALGHRALKLLAKMRGDEVDELFRWTGLAIGDADEAEAIIRELRGES